MVEGQRSSSSSDSGRGQIEVTLEQLAAMVTDRNNQVVILGNLFGYQHRPQTWSTVSWRSRWHCLFLIEAGRVVLPDGDYGPGVAIARSPRQDGPAVFDGGVRFCEVWFSIRDHHDRRVTLDTTPIIAASAGHLRPVFDLLMAQVGPEPEREHPLTSAGRHCLGLLLALFDQARARADQAHLSPEVRSRLARWLLEHLDHGPTPADLARIAGLSPDYFSRVFARSYGMPPRRWLVVERVRVAARDLLETDDEVRAIGERCGFHDPSHFGRVFREVMGTSPMAWRRQR